MEDLARVSFTSVLAYTVPAVCSMVATLGVAWITNGTRRKISQEVEPRIQELHDKVVNGESKLK